MSNGLLMSLTLNLLERLSFGATFFLRNVKLAGCGAESVRLCFSLSVSEPAKQKRKMNKEAMVSYTKHVGWLKSKTVLEIVIPGFQKAFEAGQVVHGDDSAGTAYGIPSLNLKTCSSWCDITVLEACLTGTLPAPSPQTEARYFV